MTRNTVIWTLNSVETPFCQSFSQICYKTCFASTDSTGVSDLLSARGVTHSQCITHPFLASFSARGRAHCGCQLPHLSARVACCCFLFLGIHICSPPHNSIQFPSQSVGGVCLLVNEDIRHDQVAGSGCNQRVVLVKVEVSVTSAATKL